MPNFREGLNSVYWKIDHPFYLGYIFRRVWPLSLILSLWPFFNQYANPFFAMALALVYSSLKVNINYNKFLFVQLIPLFEESKSWMSGTQVFLHRTNFIKTTEAYSQPCHTSKKELTLKIVNCVKPLTIFTKRFFLDVWQGSEYTSEQPDLIWLCQVQYFRLDKSERAKKRNEHY